MYFGVCEYPTELYWGGADLPWPNNMSCQIIYFFFCSSGWKMSFCIIKNLVTFSFSSWIFESKICKLYISALSLEDIAPFDLSFASETYFSPES